MVIRVTTSGAIPGVIGIVSGTLHRSCLPRRMPCKPNSSATVVAAVSTVLVSPSTVMVTEQTGAGKIAPITVLVSSRANAEQTANPKPDANTNDRASAETRRTVFTGRFAPMAHSI